MYFFYSFARWPIGSHSHLSIERRARTREAAYLSSLIGINLYLWHTHSFAPYGPMRIRWEILCYASYFARRRSAFDLTTFRLDSPFLMSRAHCARKYTAYIESDLVELIFKHWSAYIHISLERKPPRRSLATCKCAAHNYLRNNTKQMPKYYTNLLYIRKFFTLKKTSIWMLAAGVIRMRCIWTRQCAATPIRNKRNARRRLHNSLRVALIWIIFVCCRA